MGESVERMVARMGAAREFQGYYEHVWAIGYNDARDEMVCRVSGWCNADRAAYHDGWMAQITE